MINQWKNSIEWCEFIDEMSYTRSFIKIESLFEDDNIKMQDLIRLNNTFCEDFLHQSMHLRDSTRLAIHCFWWFIFIFFDHLDVVNFFQLMYHLWSTMTQSEMSKSRRRFCHSRFSRLNRICMLIQVFLTDEIKFQQQHVALHAYFAYFCIRLHINEMLIWESRSYSSLINLVNEIRITSIDEIQVVFANFNLTIYCSACHWRSSFHSQQHSSIH